jgi:hypothetical protein
MDNGKLVHNSILKPIKKSIMQGGTSQEQVSYELDNKKIFSIVLE